jgi:hypothetical protein
VPPPDLAASHHAVVLQKISPPVPQHAPSRCGAAGRLRSDSVGWCVRCRS